VLSLISKGNRTFQRPFIKYALLPFGNKLKLFVKIEFHLFDKRPIIEKLIWCIFPEIFYGMTQLQIKHKIPFLAYRPIGISANLFYQNTITFPTSFLVSPFVEMSVNDSDLKSLEI